jgi:hypothetical protein
MRNAFIPFLVVAMALAGCAHRGAIRVECKGPLRPINQPAEVKGTSVRVGPASPSVPKSGEAQP